MSKRTLALIAALTAITALLLVAALSSPTIHPKKQAILTTPTVTPYIGHTTLSLVPAAGTASLTPPININVDSGGDNLTGVQVEIAYDPAVVTNVHIAPATFFPDPFV